MTLKGTQISERYELLEHVGRGGMQDVYKAKDYLLDQFVALKTPLPGQSKTFKKSAVIAARVNQYNVAKTYDYFEEGGASFIVEEFVDGSTLDDALIKRSGFVDPHLGAKLFHCLAKGIAASHHAGVVHRDLKPSNVMVVGGFDCAQIKITDFGIATLTEKVFEEAARSGDLTKSTSGTVRGALPYMAPEMMFRNPGEHPGTEADIWSLGAMMFHLLAGIVPYGYGFEVPVNIRTAKRAPWPSFMTDNQQFAPLALELQRLVDTCLVIDPSARPTADEIVKLCSEICYFSAPRSEGVVKDLRYNGAFGFIADKGEKTIFFNSQSVYGPHRIDKEIKNKVVYSYCSGQPYPRAHPVLVVEE